MVKTMETYVVIIHNKELDVKSDKLTSHTTKHQLIFIEFNKSELSTGIKQCQESQLSAFRQVILWFGPHACVAILSEKVMNDFLVPTSTWPTHHKSTQDTTIQILQIICEKVTNLPRLNRST